MSDARLRALERQALASGTVEDRAALLRARVRAGELTLDRIELAAYCGDEAALVVDGGNCRKALMGKARVSNEAWKVWVAKQGGSS